MKLTDLLNESSTDRLNERLKPITKKHWDKADEDQRLDWLLQAFREIGDAEKYVDYKWNNLPSTATQNMYESANARLNEGWMDLLTYGPLAVTAALSALSLATDTAIKDMPSKAKDAVSNFDLKSILKSIKAKWRKYTNPKVYEIIQKMVNDPDIVNASKNLIRGPRGGRRPDLNNAAYLKALEAKLSPQEIAILKNFLEKIKGSEVGKTKSFQSIQKYAKGESVNERLSNLSNTAMKRKSFNKMADALNTLTSIAEELVEGGFEKDEIRKFILDKLNRRLNYLLRESVNEVSYKVAGRQVELIKGKKSDGTDWKVKFQNGKEVPLSDVLALIKPFPKGIKESVNEASMELKKLETAIEMFQNKIKKQGRVTNARDEEHLKNLIKVYKEMGGKKIKESVNEAMGAVDFKDGLVDYIGDNPKLDNAYNSMKNPKDFMKLLITTMRNDKKAKKLYSYFSKNRTKGALDIIQKLASGDI